MAGKMLHNVTLLSLAIDDAGFASVRLIDNDSGEIYTVPGGYVMLTENPRTGYEPCEPGAIDDAMIVIGDVARRYPDALGQNSGTSVTR